jgi:hypothetical protein
MSATNFLFGLKGFTERIIEKAEAGHPDAFQMLSNLTTISLV